MSVPSKVVADIVNIMNERPALYAKEIKYAEHLHETLFYTAPECRWARVWLGGPVGPGLYDICAKNIKGERELDKKIQNVYNAAYKAYKASR